MSLLFVSSWQASGQNTNFDTAAHNVVWAQRLEQQVCFLCDSICQGRATRSRGNVEAQFWLSTQFYKMRLLPLGYRFGEDISISYANHMDTPDGKCCRNIIGMLPASTKKPVDSYVIVGAHYDGKGILNGTLYPGADSNASGTVAMLNIAQMFSSMKLLGKTYRSNILFVAFDAKELSMSGSNAMWKALKGGHILDPLTCKPITPDKVKLMVNIDQIGGVSDPVHKDRKDYLIMLGNTSLARQYQGTAEYCNRLYTKLDLSFTYYGSARFSELFYKLSDQRVFVENKKPAVFFTSGITMKTNKPSDSPETLDYEVLRQRIIFMYHWIEKML